jgi:hypothetical protein
MGRAVDPCCGSAHHLRYMRRFHKAEIYAGNEAEYAQGKDAANEKEESVTCRVLREVRDRNRQPRNVHDV